MSQGSISFYIYSVFWDLYCAAPERRDSCDHSSEAKAFHDYVSLFIDSITSVQLWVQLRGARIASSYSC